MLKKYQIDFITRFCLLSAIFLLLTNCQTKTATTNSISETSREMTDDLGRRVKIPAKVDRAVSLAPNLTEIIFAVDAGGKLVGDTTYCDYPEEAKKIQKIGDTMNPNLETIIALKPQVIFVSTASQIESFTKNLEAQNIAVFITNPKDLESIYSNIFQVGEILGKGENAKRLVDEMKRRVADVETRTNNSKDVRTFVQISPEPLFTIGKDSFITDLIARAGGISATADVPEQYPKYSKETALALQPEAIILSESSDNATSNDVFKNSPAVKNNRVFKIEANLLSRPGPRVIDGLEQIAKALHPESFE